MSYKKQDLSYYQKKLTGQLIPLHPWNKKINNENRGKTPIDREWNTSKYNNEQVEAWITQGYNLGYRLTHSDLIVDLDPRNYVSEVDSEKKIAELFGFNDFDELLWELPIVKTGSGGYHIYCKLPNNVDSKNLKKCVEEIPGVDFKKLGGYVVSAGSRHPNGEYYQWENFGTVIEVTPKLINLLLRDPFENKYTVGYGSLNGTQLQAMILDKLDIKRYVTNAEWEPIMMACHHATGGDGLEEFIEWSCADKNYSDDAHKIRVRWESLVSDKSISRTIGSLIHELKITGEDTSSLKAILDFNSVEKIKIGDSENLEDDSILETAKEAADNIDISEIMKLPKNVVGVEGNAIIAAKELTKNASIEDKMRCIRLIKAASIEESIEAQEILIDNKIMTQGAINKRLKALDETIIDSITEILANTTINAVFNDSKHVMTEPNKQVWIFKKTNWRPISDEFLGKIIYRVLDTLKTKMNISANEVILVSAAVRAVRMRTSNESAKLFATDNFLPIINCTNGEVWIKQDGTHTLKQHNPKSFRTNCLNTEYDPSAKCDLFLSTLRDIFSNFNDCDEMIRHIGEILGYVIQPYKPDANWWLMRGPGGDGKSTIIKVLNGILGESLYTADQNLLAVATSRGNNHATSDLVGKLAVVIQELDENSHLNDSGLKMLSENTKMTANPKNRDTFSFNYVGSLLMCCNAFPVIKGTTEGTLRRANIIPFNKQFIKNGNADTNRAQKIVGDKVELSGVLNFMLEGYQRYVSRGRFNPPNSCVLAKQEWLCNANNVVRFVDDNIIVVDDKTKILGRAADVYNRYAQWCIEEGANKLGRNKFYISLDNLGIKRKVGHEKTLQFYGAEFVNSDFDSLDDFDL